ncbi:hypothetical protein FC99_GL000240 [Levilactobacillus koreensis JCM 16448]|uniref:DNA alkylation repair protein n=1 Tax=Levilactobacillus koreensis TaxID=637971 RepID=A0AAC8UUI9_9LACO|nr:DNA alkylation repair protein [Levilactobacillus koreensis]AKP64458.1 hypothetical protein ABN16_05230 [Levilactobacillus koreensis]KRK92530.1 hypothetical protein FC99_GL000240 [Levilactobacillus koreensis JCM 16448]
MNLTTIKWDRDGYQAFLEELAGLGNPQSVPRMAKIVPTERPILGIPMKTLRELGKAISQGTATDFLQVAGTEYYEVIIIQGYVISNLPLTCSELAIHCEHYISLADNWAVCDMVIHFKQVRAFREKFLAVITRYLKSTNPWQQRVGLVFLLKFYLTPEMIATALQLASGVTSNHYYVQMGQAWLLAAAFSKQPAEIYELLRTGVSLAVVQRTVAKIKSLTHTTPAEKAELTAILKERRRMDKGR